MTRRIRTECPRCGQTYDKPDLVTELKETKEALRKLQRSVATEYGRMAGLSQRMKKARRSHE